MCCLFLQVPDFNSLLSDHLILQPSDNCKCNIDVYLFPQAPLELTPELLQPYLTTAWPWQRGEQPLTGSILCDWFQHPNPWPIGGLWIFIRDCYSTAAFCKGITLPKGAWVQACLFLPRFLHISFDTLLWAGWPLSIPLWAALFSHWIL